MNYCSKLSSRQSRFVRPTSTNNHHLTQSQKDKEDLEELTNELELVDEDDNIPYAPSSQVNAGSNLTESCLDDRYRIGDSFVSLPLPEIQELLSASTEKIDQDVSAVEEKLSALRDEMQELKVALYARFGKSINLET